MERFEFPLNTSLHGGEAVLRLGTRQYFLKTGVLKSGWIIFRLLFGLISGRLFRSSLRVFFTLFITSTSAYSYSVFLHRYPCALCTRLFSPQLIRHTINLYYNIFGRINSTWREYIKHCGRIVGHCVGVGFNRRFCWIGSCCILFVVLKGCNKDGIGLEPHEAFWIGFISSIDR